MYRILSIDGGGIKGVFPAAFLETIEEATNKRVVDHFDLIVGTSTGGIIALGLGLGFSAGGLKEFYLKHGSEIFPPAMSAASRLCRWVKAWGKVRYPSTALRDALEKTFGARRLGESRARLVIPAMNAANGEVHTFKTAHHPSLQVDYKASIVDVALATSAAPTYFPNHEMADGIRLIDGGMWANSPILVAAFEAIYVLDQEPEQVQILSLGCTGESLSVTSKVGRSGGKIAWGVAAVEWTLRGQAESAHNMCRLMLGRDHVHRIQPIVPPGRFALDDATAIKELEGLGKTEARKALPAIEGVFFQTPVPSFIPCSHL